MKKYFKFRKDFRCNWQGILGAYDTTNLEEQVVEQQHIWHRIKSSLIPTKLYYCDVFIFESDGETEEYVNDLNKILGGLAYFVRKEDEYDTIEELCDEFVFIDEFFKREHRLAYSLENALARCKYHNVDITTLRGAIWTNKGLIYVAKMNEKGKMELL